MVFLRETLVSSLTYSARTTHTLPPLAIQPFRVTGWNFKYSILDRILLNVTFSKHRIFNIVLQYNSYALISFLEQNSIIWDGGLQKSPLFWHTFMIESWVVFVQNYTDRQSQKPLIHVKVIACSCFLTRFEDLKNTGATNEYLKHGWRFQAVHPGCGHWWSLPISGQEVTATSLWGCEWGVSGEGAALWCFEGIWAVGAITSWQIDEETVDTVADFILGAPKSLQMVIAVMKLKDAYSLEGKLRPT